MKLKYFFALFLVMLLFTSSGCGGGDSNKFAVLPDDDRAAHQIISHLQTLTFSMKYRTLRTVSTQ